MAEQGGRLSDRTKERLMLVVELVIACCFLFDHTMTIGSAVTTLVVVGIGVPLFLQYSGTGQASRGHCAPAGWRWSWILAILAAAIGSMYLVRWLGLDVGPVGVSLLVMLLGSAVGLWDLRRRFPWRDEADDVPTQP